ncbi:Polyprenol monophosphomannose synthase [bacterium HR24]|nr:Polyprenol monophosphomannose synthase [bacterium HR24]
MRTVIVIPTLNERAAIEQLWRRLEEVARAHSLSALALFVDDGSTDGTREAVMRLTSNDRHLRPQLLDGPRRGYSAAVHTGIELALGLGATRLLTMDGDLSHRPEELPRLVAALDAGAELAVGSRLVPGARWHAPLWRKWLTRSYSLAVALLAAPPVRDVSTGFRAFTPQAAQMALAADPGLGTFGWLLAVCLLAKRAAIATAELPISYAAPASGSKLLSPRRLPRYLSEVAKVVLLHREGALYRALEPARGSVNPR